MSSSRSSDQSPGGRSSPNPALSETVDSRPRARPAPADVALSETVDSRPRARPAPADVALSETLASSSGSPFADGTSAELSGPRSGPGDTTLGETLSGDPKSLDPALVARVSLGAAAFPVQGWARYEFIKLLGQGGMGAVYKARDRQLGRTVALKFIRGGDPNLVMRFLQEARAQARIDQPGICKVYEVGEVEGKAYIAMQFVDGLPLGEVAKALSLVEKVRIVRDAARALHAAHSIGIIHRDIKPHKIAPDTESLPIVSN